MDPASLNDDVTAGNKVRTHKNDELRPAHVGQSVSVSGWVHRKRDHGNLLFIDLRDHYGVTQVVFTPDSDAFASAEAVKLESVISVAGKVIARTDENINPALPTGRIEVVADRSRCCRPPTCSRFKWQAPGDPGRAAAALSFPRSPSREDPRERRPAIEGDFEYRRRMVEQGFSSTNTDPHRARPRGRGTTSCQPHSSRQFYALPQAQQHSSSCDVSGFDRYSRLAPCFRDEDARADRFAGRVLSA